MSAFRRGSYEFAGFRLDPIEKILFRGNQPVMLTPKAVETLLVLVERHGRLVTKDEMFALVWPNAFVEENNLAQNISMLRRALGEKAAGRQFIETVPKRGYRFVEPVAKVGDDDPPAVPVEQGAPPPPGGHTRRLGIVGAAVAIVVVALAIALGSRAGNGAPGTVERGEQRPVEVRPTADTEAYLAFLRGIAAYRGGDSDTSNQSMARAELERAVARDPRFALAWSWLARTYTSQYRSGADRSLATRDAAYRAARKAIELDDAPDGHLALGQALYGDREYAAARRELEIARVGLPDSVELWQLLAHVAQAEGRWKDARAAFMRAFDLDSAATADWVAVHHLHMRDYSEARRFIGIARAANKAGSVVPDAWLRFSDGGDVAAARPFLEAALAGRSPADARVRGLLARLEWFDGRYERALELIRGMDPAGAWLPANHRFPASLAAGQVYESMGDRKRARRSYEDAIAALETRRRATPDDYQVLAALGLAAVGLGRTDEAVRYGRRAVELLPVSRDSVEGPLYLYLLAQIHSRAGQYDQAFSTLDQMFVVPGFYNESWLERDPGFAALRRQPAFAAYLERWSARKGDALLERP